MGTNNSYNKYILILFVVGLAILLGMHGYVYYNQEKTEGFTEEYLPNLRACPAALNEYTSKDAINCCQGSVENGKCTGVPACTLSAHSGKLPRCVNWISSYATTKGVEVCPTSLPLYYETKDGGFCTGSPLKRDTAGPQDENARKCRVYENVESKLELEDSCYNVRRLENMKMPPGVRLFFKGFDKIIHQGKKFLIPWAAYKDSEGRSKSCDDRVSAENLMDFKNPTWRSDPAEVKRINEQACI